MNIETLFKFQNFEANQEEMNKLLSHLRRLAEINPKATTLYFSKILKQPIKLREVKVFRKDNSLTYRVEFFCWREGNIKTHLGSYEFSQQSFSNILSNNLYTPKSSF